MHTGHRIAAAGASVAIASVLALVAPAAAYAQDADACIAASDSALSARKGGKLLEARKALATCAEPACPDPVKSSCQQRLQDVDRAVPSVVFQVKDGAGNDVPSVKVTVDGQPRDERVGAALSLDPGSHTFTFEAPGLPTATKTLVLVEGVKERPETVTLGTPAPPPAAASTVQTDQVPASSGSAQKTIGFVVGGVGVAGLAVGSIFGLMASSTWSRASTEKQPNATPDSHTAGSQATISTIGFIAGGVLVAGGIVLWLTAPREPSAAAIGLAPGVGPGIGGLTLRGGF